MMQYITSQPALSAGLLGGAVVIVAGVALYVYKKRGINGLREEAYKLFIAAEHLYEESGSGKEKFTYVVTSIYELLPSVLKLLVTEKELEKIIQIWFDEIKDLLDDGKLNDSTKGA